MYTPVHCIALGRIPYNDAKSLLRAWSLERGFITLAMPEKGREAVRRRALTMPLSFFEGEVDFKPGHEVFSMRDVSLSSGSPAITGALSAPAVFAAAVLTRVLRSSTPHAATDSFIRRCALSLASAKSLDAAMLHIPYMLLGLTHMLGIAPALEPTDNPGVFDLREGRLRATHPFHPDFTDSDFTAKLIKLSTTVLTELSRNETLLQSWKDLYLILGKYYAIHLSPVTLPPLPDWL